MVKGQEIFCYHVDLETLEILNTIKTKDYIALFANTAVNLIAS